MRVVVLLLVLLANAGFAIGRAASVPDLYEADVPIADRSEAERARAQSAALARVLVKLTGDRGAAGKPAAAALVRNAARYAQQFQYVQGMAGTAPNAATLGLRVRFDQRGLDAAMSAAGLPIWGKERPRALLAVTVDDGARRTGISGAQRGGHAEVLIQRAVARGIPVAVPRLDAEDIARLGTAGAAGVAALAPRYAADAVAHGEVSGTGPIRSQWTLSVDGTTSQWSGTADSVAAALEQGVDALADALATRYAAPLAGAGAETIEVRVSGVRSVTDYARVQRYLDALDAVTAVSTRAVDADWVLFALTVRGGGAALESVVGLGDVLAPTGTGGYQLRRP